MYRLFNLLHYLNTVFFCILQLAVGNSCENWNKRYGTMTAGKHVIRANNNLFEVLLIQSLTFCMCLRDFKIRYSEVSTTATLDVRV